MESMRSLGSIQIIHEMKKLHDASCTEVRTQSPEHAKHAKAIG